MLIKQKFVNPLSYAGFSLIELAIVLIIVGFLLAAFLTPLSAQRDANDYARARLDLSQIKEALYGYAIVNGKLPCPDTTGDGIQDACPNTNANATTAGNLPWVTLGLEQNDPWGRRYQYRINNAFSAIFNLNTVGTGAGVINVFSDSTLTTTFATNIPAVVYSSGKNGATQPPVSSDELENTVVTGATFNQNFVSHDLSTTFDDVITWISPNVLFDRMVTAGRLP